MSSLRPVGLGPIVGHVTFNTARIWIRAGDPKDAGADIARHRRTLGVIAIVKVNGKKLDRKSAYYFRLQREFDRTGVFTLGRDTGIGEKNPSPKLTPGTKYSVRVGTLTIDDPNPDGDSIADEILGQRLPSTNVWVNKELEALNKEESLAEFTTAPNPAAEPGDLAFLLGSCRYPGLLWKAKHADQIFGPMLEEALGHDDRSAVDMVLMVGDQIYADKTQKIKFGRADTFEEFQERYHTAFGSRRMRKLLRKVPTYMILDDHEIEDNWTQDRIRKCENRNVFNNAIEAYTSYQWLHGPRNYGRRFFYNFTHGGYPFFVLDTRTQRYMDDIADQLEDNHMLGRPGLIDAEPGQLDHLLYWLDAVDKKVPKFIVTSSVFVPNPMNAREGRMGTNAQKVKWKEASDSWPAFPKTRRAILKSIVDNKLQNVIFLSGDIHCSNVATLRFNGTQEAEKLKAFSVTSSAFYWPWPFADGEPSSYVHDSRAKGQEDTFKISEELSLDYKAFNFTQEDNFCRIDIDRKNRRMTVVPYDDTGAQIKTGGWLKLAAAPLEAKLELVCW